MPSWLLFPPSSVFSSTGHLVLHLSEGAEWSDRVQVVQIPLAPDVRAEWRLACGSITFKNTYQAQKRLTRKTGQRLERSGSCE
eukprot:CAMPEP_0175286266 /NCGR_PEP_ID=MMETSP0093-20121207/53671_1 /TAXON_ID=311494 /ORGANISM="Alexandrium monilatum, Strain CCMP3105" /LENGTH=82 /DNA_ID=CAMNT_0016581719 /DNA_START=14 /DNA_END=259 /DNA_ORIENTATION=+